MFERLVFTFTAIYLVSKYTLYAFSPTHNIEAEGAKTTLKLNTSKQEHAFLIAYGGLLLLTISILVLQGGLWVLAGLGIWATSITALFLYRLRDTTPYNAKTQKELRC